MAQHRLPGVLIQSGRTDVVISTPPHRDAVREASRLSALIEGCRRRLDVTPADSASFVNAEPPALSLGFRAQDVLIFSVLPHQGSAVDCGDEQTQLTIAAMRGLRVTTDTSYVPDRDLQQVIIRRGTTVVPAGFERRETLRRLVPGGLRDPRTGWIVLAFDAAHFAPGPSGVTERITIEVRSAAGGIPEVFELPWSAIRRAWERSIVARTTPDLNALLFEPGNARERLAARARTGSALSTRGDSVAARIVLGALLSTEPCFTFAPATDARTQRLVEAMRPTDARCTAQRNVVTLARAALLPGFGRPGSADGRLRRAALTAAIATSGLMAMHQSRVANERYQAYLSLQYVGVFTANPPAYDIVYGHVEDSRLLANRLGAAAVALWGAQVMHALWLERRYAGHLAAVRGFDASRGSREIGFAPFVDADRVGIMGRMGW